MYIISICIKNSCKAIVEISSNQARVNEKASMRAVAKILQHEQVSTRVIFASSSSKGQNLRALLHWMGPFDTPFELRNNFAAFWYQPVEI